jgi:thiosulfate reductase cytochrome b subunit
MARNIELTEEQGLPSTAILQSPGPSLGPSAGDLVKRHRLSTRLWHAVNAAALLALMMSGLMIFNAHPRLYWGQYGANPDYAWFEIGDKANKGFMRIGAVTVETTGVLGTYKDANGVEKAHAFPYWATIPSNYSLADARLWHFAIAWVLALALLFYMIRSLWNGHIWRDLHISRQEWAPRHIWQDIKDHSRLRFPKGIDAVKYNILQKLSYISVIFIALPVMILTGLTMSPGMNAAFPWLLDIFGGRQSARSIHFIVAFALLAFFVVHMIMVMLAGPFNEVRSIITGKFRLPGKPDMLATSLIQEDAE